MDPAFHLKARSSRFGANFEFPDVSRKLTLTGRAEADFEGNFSRADNRNVSTYRSSMLGLRLAYARLDYAATENTDVFFEGGQDWTIYGSSLLGNLLETTFFGAYFGQTYERAPQMRLGFTQKLPGPRNVKFSPEVAIMMPLEGLVPAGATGSLNADSGAALGNQLGYGERQGQDANRPELETRAVLQFQLAKAPGVASAELIASAFRSMREAIILPGEVPAAFDGAPPEGCDHPQQRLWHSNRSTTSDPMGHYNRKRLPRCRPEIHVRRPTHLDLQQYFRTKRPASAPSIDGATTQFFGINSCGVAVLAPQRAVRGYGGLVNVGLPLSRWFTPIRGGTMRAGRCSSMLAWTHANAHDFRYLHNIWAPGTTLPGADGAVAAGPQKSTMGAATLYYKFNQSRTFAYEESLYSSYAIKNFNGTYIGAATGALAGQRVWKDRREEFGPIFTSNRSKGVAQI